jgi:Polysaccharide lyase
MFKKIIKHFKSVSLLKKVISGIAVLLLMSITLSSSSIAVDLKPAGDTTCVNISNHECAGNMDFSGSGAVEWSDGSTRTINSIEYFGSFSRNLAGVGNTEVKIDSVGTDNGVIPRLGNKMVKFSKAGPYMHRAELTDASFNHPTKDTLGNRFNYWYGWSLYIPDDPNWNSTQDWQQSIGQWRYSNVSNCYSTVTPDNKYIGGSGMHMAVSNGRFIFTDVPSSDVSPGRGTDEQEHDLGPATKGQWVDFIMQAKWSPFNDGVQKIWMQTGGTGYHLMLDRQNTPNWLDTYNVSASCSVSGQVVPAPNWQVGMYAGDDSLPLNNPRIMYADEMREYRTIMDGSEGSEAWKKVIR